MLLLCILLLVVVAAAGWVLKLVLGLIWAIFVYYEVLSIPDVKSVADLKGKILAWVKRRTARYSVTHMGWGAAQMGRAGRARVGHSLPAPPLGRQSAALNLRCGPLTPPPPYCPLRSFFFATSGRKRDQLDVEL